MSELHNLPNCVASQPSINIKKSALSRMIEVIQKYDYIPESHFESISTRTADEVRKLLRTIMNILGNLRDSSGKLIIPKKITPLPTRKDEMCNLIMKFLSSEDVLRMLYNRLGALEKVLVQEAVHDPHGMIELEQFKAKHGGIPDYSIKTLGMKQDVPLLCLFFTGKEPMPNDLRKHLLTFVPEPPAVKGSFTNSLPTEIESSPAAHHSHREKLARIEFIKHETEKASLHDLGAILQLIDNGKVSVSSNTGRVTEKGAKAIREVLLCGDFYPEGLEYGEKYDVTMGIAGIRPFAWPMILQAGKMVKIEGSKLKLTHRKALVEPHHKVLRKLWDLWLANTFSHEMNRVEVIKGQRSRGHPLSSASICREAIANALSELPEGKWIEIEEFFRLLITNGHNFEVARDPWSLYLVDRQYGSFGYSHIKWGHLNGRFTRAFLLEYAATMGLIDVALIPPWGAVDDMGDLWGADEYSCLSRYDGLKYIKLTPLGAWILGIKDEYKPESTVKTGSVFRILPNMEIIILAHTLLPSDKLFLDRIGKQKSERVWEFSKDKILLAVEKGLQMTIIRDFLLSRNEGDFPSTVEVTLKDMQNQIDRLKYLEPCIMIECDDKSTAILLANDTRLREFCLLAEDRYLIVKERDKNTFCRLLRKLGYVLPLRSR